MKRKIIIVLCGVLAVLMISICLLTATAFETLNRAIIEANNCNISELQSEDDDTSSIKHLLKIRVLGEYELDEEGYLNRKTKYSFPKFEDGKVNVKCNITAYAHNSENLKETFKGERIITLEFSKFKWHITDVKILD